MTKMNVESFNLDHTKVVAPFIRLAGTMEGLNGDVIHKYDIRFKQPNKEHMDMPGLHSLEHLMAENISNQTLHDVLNASEVPACNEVQCGWAASHSLEGAKTIAQAFLDKREQWNDIYGEGK